MRKNYLLKPNVTEKTFKVKNLEEITDHAESIITGKTLTSFNMSSVPVQGLNHSIMQMFYVNGKTYAVCGNASEKTYLYEQIGEEFVQKFSVGQGRASMGEVILNGRKEVLYMDEEVAKIVDNNKYTVRFPLGKHFATYSLRCFSATDTVIYFGRPFSFTTKTMMLDNCGNIGINPEDGKILGIYDFSSYLLVVCSKCFYKLTIVEDEFKFEKLNLGDYAIEEKSLAKTREKLFFVANKKLYVYEEYVVKEIPCVYAKHMGSVYSYATADSDHYYCELTIGNRNCALVYDLAKKVCGLVYLGTITLMCRNVGVSYAEQYLYRVEASSTVTSLWTSLPINFDTNDKKALVEISVNVSKAVTLTVSGDFGKKVFSLKGGVNHKRMNLWSKEFIIEIECPTKDIEVSNLQFKYIV